MMRHVIRMIGPIVALLLAGCGTSRPAGAVRAIPSVTPLATSRAAPSPVPATSTYPEAFHATAAAMTWLSEPQAGIRPWLSAIDRAQHTIDLNDYLLTDTALIQALIAAAHRGVRVEVIIDGHPYGDSSAVAQTEAAFQGSGVQLKVAPARFDESYAFDHAKYLVIDPGAVHAIGILGSPNGTASAFEGYNLEDAVETTAPTLTNALAAVFHADWTGTRAGAMPRQSLVLSPGAQGALVHLLSASGPVAVMAEELGDAPALYQALDAHGRTARVLVPASLSVEGQRYAAALVQAGVQVRTLASPDVHAKLIITAHQTFVGSQNLSAVSLHDNREVGLITGATHIHTQALAWFDLAWARATPWHRSAALAGGGTTSSSRRWPYLPDGDTMGQVHALWGRPASVSFDTYHGIPETLWHYSAGTVYFEHGAVTDIKRVD